jgi:hypothetical protein
VFLAAAVFLSHVSFYVLVAIANETKTTQHHTSEWFKVYASFDHTS